MPCLCLNVSMNNDPYQTGQTPYSQEFISQLNNAPTAPLPKNKIILLIGGAVIALLLLIVVAMNLFADRTPKVTITEVMSLTKEIGKVADDYHKKLNGTAIRELNGTIISTLANFNSSANNYYLSNTTKEQRTSSGSNNKISALAETVTKLDEAELINQTDRVYAVEIQYHLRLLVGEATQLANQTQSQELKNILAQNIDSFNKILEKFKTLRID